MITVKEAPRSRTICAKLYKKKIIIKVQSNETVMKEIPKPRSIDAKLHNKIVVK